MKNEQEENFELSLNQKRFWFLNKDNFEQLYTQLSTRFLSKVPVEELTAILNRMTDTHETLSSRLVSDSHLIFPLQTPTYYRNASIEVLPETAYEGWKASQENETGGSDLQTILPIQFFIFSDPQNNVAKLVYRVCSFWTDLYGSFKILDNISAVLSGIEISSPGDEGFIVHKNFAAWQNELISEENNEGLLFWSKYTYDLEKKLIPFGETSGPVFQPKKLNLSEIKGDQLSELRAWADKTQIDLELHFLAGLIRFLREYEESTMTLGYSMFGRVYEVLNETVGLISKTVPLEIDERFDMNDKESVQNLVDSIEKVKDWSDYYGANSLDGSAEKLKFKVCFQYIDTSLSFQNLRTSNCVIEDVFSVQETFEIKLAVTNFGDRLTIELYYDVNSFTDTEIAVIRDQLTDSLNETIKGSYFPVKNSEVIASILNKLNGYEATDINLDISILDLIQKQVELQPDAIAIQSESDQITYSELWRKTNSLANYLINEYGPTNGKPIAVLLNNAPDYILSILGILKSGAFFVPLDPSTPEFRLNFVLSDCNCSVLITEKAFESKIDFPGKFLFYEEVSTLTVNPDRNPQLLAERAYVIYTSGSSGFPKGVMVSHRSLTNYISWAKEYYSEPNDLGNSGLFTSFSFDLTLTSIFVPLVNGKIIFTQNEHLPVNEKLINLLENPKIDLIKLTPSHINLLSILDCKVKGSKIIICGGESLTTQQVQLLYKLIPGVRVYNEYGPTEATVGCIVKQISPEDKRILIGCPISNTKIKIVGKNGECSVGSVGEILIGGECLSMGYLNNPEETKRSFFLPDAKSTELFYKSGDLGRLLPNGDLEYIGRKDDQIKIRGYRIELGEIEHHIKTHSDISDAVVIYKKTELNEGELIAFIVSTRSILSSELRDFLKSALPDYMIPPYFLMIEKIPLTSNGKVDRKSLSDLQGKNHTMAVEYVAPRNEIEEKLVKIWEDVLQKDNIGVKDDFFVLGGHSLKAIRLINQINKQLGVKYDLREIYGESTIELIAERIKIDTYFKTSNIENENDYEEIKI